MLKLFFLKQLAWSAGPNFHCIPTFMLLSLVFHHHSWWQGHGQQLSAADRRQSAFGLYHGCNQPVSVNNENAILITDIERILPNGTEAWCLVVLTYKEESGEEMLHNEDHLHNNCVITMSNNFKNPLVPQLRIAVSFSAALQLRDKINGTWILKLWEHCQLMMMMTLMILIMSYILRIWWRSRCEKVEEGTENPLTVALHLNVDLDIGMFRSKINQIGLLLCTILKMLHMQESIHGAPYQAGIRNDDMQQTCLPIPLFLSVCFL